MTKREVAGAPRGAGARPADGLLMISSDCRVLSRFVENWLRRFTDIAEGLICSRFVTKTDFRFSFLFFSFLFFFLHALIPSE